MTHRLRMFLVVETVLARGRTALLQWLWLTLLLRVWVPDRHRARLVRVNNRMCQPGVGLRLVLLVLVAVARVVERVVVAVVEASAFTRLRPALASRALRLKMMVHLLGFRHCRLLRTALVAEGGATGAVRGVGVPREPSGRLRTRRLSARLVVSEGRTLLWILRAIAVSSSTGCIVAQGNP